MKKSTMKSIIAVGAGVLVTGAGVVSYLLGKGKDEGQFVVKEPTKEAETEETKENETAEDAGEEEAK